MKLEKVLIENFRSIKSLKIDFTTAFRILVGKNESGKSNIIKALALLNPDAVISPDDVRESDELTDGKFSSEIVYDFRLNKEEIERVYSEVKAEIKIENFEEYIIGRVGNKDYTLLDFCNLFSVVSLEVNLITSKRRYTYWGTDEEIQFNKELKWNSSNVSGFEGFRLIDVKLFPSESIDLLLDFEVDDLHDLIHRYNEKILKANYPKVIDWKYDEKHLLPDRISISEFKESPSSFLPLKTMFELAGIRDISISLSKIFETKNYHKINNYLERVATKTTSHFRQIWKEYKEVEFTLNADGESIITGIKETNTYSFKQRSDGFKRFVTFLLMVSATYETSNLLNTIILIDEPDIALHPSGIRFLRDELIKISADNTILASTHSIFLIDKTQISRHYIVKKKNEITEIEEANDENLITEEVLFNALGFSFYEVLKSVNIAFEGWRDKLLFQRALEKVPPDFKFLKESFKDFGVTHINGVKEAQGIAPLFELADRKYIIVSDSDAVALEQKRNFEKKKSFGEWITYKDLDNSLVSKTGEDFLKSDYIKNGISILKKEHPELNGEPIFDNSSIIASVDIWLMRENGIKETHKRKEILDEVKNILFNNLKPSNIDVLYYRTLEKLANKLNGNSIH